MSIVKIKHLVWPSQLVKSELPLVNHAPILSTLTWIPTQLVMPRITPFQDITLSNQQPIYHQNQPSVETILGGSFTVVQNRFDGSENFDRNWADYKMGFGMAADFNSPACDEAEFWLGNEYLFNIQENKNALVVDMGRVNGQSALVKYGNFEIGNERSGYQLRAAEEFSDDECGAKVGNSLAGSDFGDQGYGQADKRKTNHIGMKFSTKDRDNDKARASCASQDRSGWWFNNCSAANLNGIFHGGKYGQKDTATGEFDDGILWNTWTQDKWEALVRTQMAIGQDKGAMLSVCDGSAVGTGGATGGANYDDYTSNYSYDYN